MASPFSLSNNLFQGTFVCLEHGGWSAHQRIVSICTTGKQRIESRDLKNRIVFSMTLNCLIQVIRYHNKSSVDGTCSIKLVGGGRRSKRSKANVRTYALGFLNAIERENFCMLLMLLKPSIRVISEGEVWIRRGVRMFHVHSARGSYQISGQSPTTLLIDSVVGKFGVCSSQWTKNPSLCRCASPWRDLRLCSSPNKGNSLQIFEGLKMLYDLRFGSVAQMYRFIGSFTALRGDSASSSLMLIPTLSQSRVRKRGAISSFRGTSACEYHQVLSPAETKIEEEAIRKARRASTVWLHHNDLSWYIYTTSFNVGGKKPPEPGSAAFRSWMQPGAYDVYAIGLQECKHRDVWLDAIDKHLNGEKRYGVDREYVVVSQVSMMNIHLFVFFRKATIDRRGVVPLSTDSKAMGIGGFVGNKGSICASFVVAETTHVCFVVSHFAARAARLNKRQKNYVESVSHLSSHVKHQLLHSYDHIFWMGDFNYRVDLGSHGTPSEFQRVNALIKQGQYDSLVRCDQLRQQMQLGSVFYGFSEGEISFAPTYRMVGGESKEYGNKRNQNPSYCDRILWRSRQGLGDVLKLNAYEACWDMNKGDHRPVVAEFEMSTRKLYRFQGLEAERRLETGAIHITNLELQIDNEVVHSNFPCRIRFEGDVLRENVGTGIRVGSTDVTTPSRTKVVWTENEIPLLATWTVDASYLAREHTIISVEVQESKGLMANRWKTTAFCELWLGPICCRYPIGSEARYSLPLIYNGKKIGNLSLSVWYVQMTEHKHNTPKIRRHSEVTEKRVLSRQNRGRDEKKMFSTNSPSSTVTSTEEDSPILLNDISMTRHKVASIAMSAGIPSSRYLQETYEIASESEDMSTEGDEEEEDEELDDRRSYLLQRIVQTQRRSVTQFLEEDKEEDEEEDEEKQIEDDDLVDPPGVMSRSTRAISSPYGDFEYDDKGEFEEEKNNTLARRRSSVEGAKRLLLEALSHDATSPALEREDPHERYEALVRESIAQHMIESNVERQRPKTLKSVKKSPRRRGKRGAGGRKRLASGTHLKSGDPIDRILLQIHRRSDPLQWVTFSVVKTKRKMKKKTGRRTKFDRASYELNIDQSGDGDLGDLTFRLSTMRVGVGVAVVKIQHKQKYIMLTYASDDVRGHEIFRVNGLRKELKTRFGAFHADMFVRSVSELRADVIMDGLSNVR